MTVGHPFASRRGRKLRFDKLRRNPLCETCERAGKVAPAQQVHHIVAIADGGDPWAWSNLESRCDACHKRAHGGRAKGEVDPATGLPLRGSGHWWDD